VNVEKLTIPDVLLITPPRFNDPRGFFSETWNQTRFADVGVPGPFVQDNHAVSNTRGVIRGLHCQIGPNAQGKLVRVISGEVFDVAVDIRPDSPTRGKWVSTVLSGDNRRMVYVPSWCAHGFCVLSETAEVLYKTTTEYAPGYESGLMWNDPALAIAWPVSSPIVSDRDTKWPRFAARQ